MRISLELSGRYVDSELFLVFGSQLSQRGNTLLLKWHYILPPVHFCYVFLGFPTGLHPFLSLKVLLLEVDDLPF